MNKFLVINVLLITLVSCGGESTIFTPQRVLDKYNIWLSNLNPDFSSHFPVDMRGTQIVEFGALFTDDYSDYPKCWLVVKSRKGRINNILDSLYCKYQPLEASDNNLFVIDDWNSLKKSGFSVQTDSLLQKRLNLIGQSSYPIPNFYQLELSGGDGNRCQLSDDFIIFVLDSNKEKLFDFFLASREYVPKNWKHGPSKGIAISREKQLVIYWFSAW